MIIELMVTSAKDVLYRGDSLDAALKEAVITAVEDTEWPISVSTHRENVDRIAEDMALDMNKGETYDLNITHYTLELKRRETEIIKVEGTYEYQPPRNPVRPKEAILAFLEKIEELGLASGMEEEITKVRNALL